MVRKPTREELEQRIKGLEAEVAECIQAKERIEHSNAILLAVRNANRLIIREKDRGLLLKGVCRSLVETRGYHNAWIALIDESGGLVMAVEAGLDDDFLPMIERMKNGEFMECTEKTLSETTVVVVEDPHSTCRGCPLYKKYPGRGAMSKRLEYEGKVYGVLSTSIPVDLVTDDKEQVLFEEVSGDVSFALYSIEREEERRQAEEALRRSENKYRTLLERLPQKIFHKDRNSAYISCNESFARDLNIEPSEIIGKTDYEFFPKELAEKYRADDKRIVEFGITEDIEENYLQNGKEIFVHTVKTPVKDENGNVTGVLGIFWDVTERKLAEAEVQKARSDLELRVKERTSELVKANEQLKQKIKEHKRAEEALRESRKRYKQLWDDAPVAYHMLDTNGIIKRVNQTETDMLGYPRDEMVNESIFKFVLPEQRKEAEERFQLKLAGERLPKQDDRIYVKKDGSKIYVSIDDVLEHDSEGNVIGIRTTMVDISEQKLAQEALKETSEKTKLFAYSVSHDLRSPAIGIYGLASRLLKDYRRVLDEKAKKYCDQILKAAEQIAKLVEMINVYISTKEAPLHIERVRLQEILQMIKDEFSTQLSIREINWFQSESLPEIKVDRISILRALRNLVDNALKYGGDQLSEIRIGYEPSDRFHTVWISNDGEGIKMEDSDKIFELFQRNERARKVQGTGLGLAIVKEIAEQHNGKVWVESDLEKGTTFYISVSRFL